MLKANQQLIVAMILSMVVWGISWPSNGILSTFGTPTAIGVFRYIVVFSSLLPLLLFLKIPLKIRHQGVLYVLVAGGCMAIYNFTFLRGLQEGSPGAGGILVTTLNPIMAYGLGMLVDWKKPNKYEGIGLILGVLAGLTLLKVWENNVLFSKGGNLFFLLSAVIWAIMSKFTSKSARYGSPFAFSLWMYLVTLLCILPFADFQEVDSLFQNRNFMFWGNLIFVGIVVTTLATTVYFYATSKLGAEKASSFIFTVPFTAALSSFLILGEQVQLHTIVGGIIGIAAVWMINKKVTI